MPSNQLFLEKKYRLYFIIVLSILFILSTCFWYDDTNSNSVHSIYIWKALFSGDFFHYYSIKAEAFNLGYTNHYGGYEVFMYFVISIWQFPLYLLERFIGPDVYFLFLAHCWTKLFFIFMIILCIHELKCICCFLHFKSNVSFNIIAIFTTSSFVISSACVVSQIDIVSLYFILIAFRFFLNNKNKSFLLFFIIATLCKSFALFIFIPLILLKEKKNN